MRLIVRAPGPAFRDAISGRSDRGTLDPERAVRQHVDFMTELAVIGMELVELPAEPDLPDATFVWDTVLSFHRSREPDGGSALLVIARPGAEARRAEVRSVAERAREIVDRDTEIVEIKDPGTLDGGDVLIFGDRVALGVSGRTDEGGARQLAEAVTGFGYRPFLCPVGGRLHLASGVSVVRADRLIGTRAGFASLDAAGPELAPIAEIERLLVPDEEAPAANVLAIGGRCIVPAGFPRTADRLRAAGEDVVEVELDEFLRADGGPTCLVAPIY
ncbi:MAG: hypothetical protein H0V12_11580 [Chloroflexi bacterium]|nr:hypothetical protein [Chloroflexota bacterium]